MALSGSVSRYRRASPILVPTSALGLGLDAERPGLGLVGELAGGRVIAIGIEGLGLGEPLLAAVGRSNGCGWRNLGPLGSRHCRARSELDRGTGWDRFRLSRSRILG